MGEVYLADDLKLGQQVALKFLPQSVESNPERLAVLQREVRVARQVSHPNVCRIYDLADADDVHFITMEYIDGEDLASVLRRIGRLPEERATAMARQLVAGVAAAHARGVIHRDLKPANVMIDADGRVRVTDFGLAIPDGTAPGEFAGTPSYMAPEQLAGKPASVKTEVFAVGLILYELFTGRRAAEGTTLEELREHHLSRSVSPPSQVVPGLHPAIDRTIMRCLDPDPEVRPASVVAIAAALPGADLLAAAIAAGETPSPELVAASGGDAATIGPLAGVIALTTVALMLLATMALVDRFGLLARLPMPLSWDALFDRARTFESTVGLGAGSEDRAAGLRAYGDGTRWILSHPDSAERARLFAGARPPALLFWYRSGPRGLIPMNPGQDRPTPADPPLNDTGMATVVLDTTGRLVEFSGVGPQLESAAAPAKAPVDWKTFFTAAGLDMTAFTPATPDWVPRNYADTRLAWAGAMPEAPGTQLRVEAASHRDIPVNFQVLGPWARPARMVPPPVNRAARLVTTVASVVVVPVFLIGGLILARRNLIRGRGDRRGAIHLAVLVFALSIGRWLLGAAHFADAAAEPARFSAALGSAILSASLYGLLYLAIEPHVRRLWPHLLVTWSRLVSGRWRDPLLGRDLVMGSLMGLTMTLITFGHYQLPGWFGWPAFAPPSSVVSTLAGSGAYWAHVLGVLSDAIGNAMLGGVGITLLRLVVRDARLAYVILTLFASFLAARGQIETGSVALDLALGVMLVVPVLWAIVRFGFVAGIVAFTVHFLTKDVPMTLDSSRLYFTDGLTVAVLVIVATGIGVVLARAREPLFGAVITDGEHGR
jgi:serine/threonine-protein kinase